MAYWDIVTSLALVFTALVTPVEVSFLDPPSPAERWSNGLFLTNRCIDIIFITDMMIQFRVAYKTGSGPNEAVQWILDPVKIARNYGCSWWFVLDFFSVATSLFDLMENEETKDLKALRAIRTLRLIKLVKLARGSRIFKRWEMRLSINYAYLSLLSITIAIFLACHWIACIWALQATFDPLNSWAYGKGYCIDWGHPDETTANQMLTDSCSGDAAMDALGGWKCNVGKCTDGTCSRGYACIDAWNMYTYSL